MLTLSSAWMPSYRLESVTEQVTVSATAVGLQTERSDIRYETNHRALQDLPTPVGRNYQSELRLMPGFSVTGGGAVRGSNPAAAFTMNVNGAPAELNNVRIDGATAANNFNQALTAYVPGFEAIQTVEAVTSSADAETGLAGGAAINVQIKSGTNQFHGSAFEFHTDNDIKARPALLPFGQGKPKLIFNQFGGTVGGPIVRDKLFFFLSYDGALSRQGCSSFATVPTEAAKLGNLAESPTPVYDPATGGLDGSGRRQFAGNLIPASRFSPISAKILPLWPTANQLGVANNYFVSASAPYNRHTVDAKVNYNLSSKLTMLARIGILDWNSYYEPVFGRQLGGLAISGQHPVRPTALRKTLRSPRPIAFLRASSLMVTSDSTAPTRMCCRSTSTRKLEPISLAFPARMELAALKADGRSSHSPVITESVSTSRICLGFGTIRGTTMWRTQTGTRERTTSDSDLNLHAAI